MIEQINDFMKRIKFVVHYLNVNGLYAVKAIPEQMCNFEIATVKVQAMHVLKPIFYRLMHRIVVVEYLITAI